MNSKLLIGSVVYGAAGIGCEVLKIEGDTLAIQTNGGIGRIAASKVLRVEPLTHFYIGDRVTLVDKYMVRAADIGTIELIDSKGIRVWWDILPQPPQLWRTFKSEELELIKRGYSQN
jgi:hypothetical protein